jgi:hypothetical protein
MRLLSGGNAEELAMGNDIILSLWNPRLTPQG